jgi:UDP-glucose:(heptosyl)LPS alpha-1,3-glucosyltransferase
VPDLLAAADLMLHPAYAESAGYTILEAVVAGLPILTTASCGYAFHVERANAGYVVEEPYQQESLNDVFTEMLEVLRRLENSRSDWSLNGLTYGSEDRFFEMPKVAVNKIEAIAERKSLGS